MHDLLFANQKTLSDEHLSAFARDLNIESEEFDACFSERTFDRQIRASQAEGQGLGVQGTPTFLLGVTNPNSPYRVNVNRIVRGAQSIGSFSAVIDDLLREASQGGPQ